MVLASCLFAVMGYFVKLGSAHFSTAELVFYRCFLGLLGIAVVVLWQRGSLRTPVLRLHLSRSIASANMLAISAKLSGGCISSGRFGISLRLLTAGELGDSLERNIDLVVMTGVNLSYEAHKAHGDGRYRLDRIMLIAWGKERGNGYVEDLGE